MPNPAFTERDVEEFFDASTETYLNFWDREGVLHTGYFAGGDDRDYPAAAERTSRLIADEAGLAGGASVLDAGCGCGNFVFYLARRFGCRCEGLDLSHERVKFAQGKLAGDAQLGPKVTFRHGSVTRLPYPDQAFSHVVSQDALFLVPDKPASHAEIHRVLAPGGSFAFSDFLQPRAEVSARARRHVYDRVRWSSGYSLVGYQVALEQAGFTIRLARDLSSHLKQTYAVLGVTARERAEVAPSRAARDWMLAFAASCQEIGVAIDDGEFGWGVFVAQRPAGSSTR